MGHSEGSPKRNIHSINASKLAQINNLRIHLKALENEEQTTPPNRRLEEIIKISKIELKNHTENQ